VAKSIAVIGAGIGGLTAAIALRRRGLPAELFERASSLSEVGAGIWMPPNAMQVFERLGVDRAVVANSVALRGVEIENQKGEVIQRFSLESARSETGFTIHSIHRGTLQRILAEAWGMERIAFDEECTAVREGPGVAIADFKSGKNISAEVLIGADGLRSKARDYVLPGVQLRDTSQTCFRGIADLELPTELKDICRETWGVRHRFGFSSIGPRAVYWFAPVSQPCDITAAEAGKMLPEVYSEFPKIVGNIIRATPPSAILKTDLADFEPISRWYRGNCVLLGDAAHATTPNLGQGAAQATESAYMLARCLATTDTTDEAFAEYQRRRIDKAHLVTNTSWMLGRAAHFEGGIARAVRDIALRNTPDAYQERQLAKFYTLGY
jgi:2-polyprenyl-6-methoxyphenol hydroxylase-like FAD-dependent oxidoreductase